MRNIIITAVLMLICFVSINAQNIDSNHVEKKHYIHATCGAPALYCGLTYEYGLSHIKKLTLMPRAGVGFNVFRPSLGKEFNIHTGATMLYGCKPSKLELGLGFIHYFMQNYNLETDKHELNYKLILYGLIGYRYEFKHNPLSLKIGITPLWIFNKDKTVFIPFAELGFGIRL